MKFGLHISAKALMDVAQIRVVADLPPQSSRTDSTFPRGDFVFDVDDDIYTCPAGKLLKRRQRRFDDRPDEVPANGQIRYRASTADCGSSALKLQCCPSQPMRAR